MHKFITALTKSGTKVPGQRTKVMPCKPFYELFFSWATNEILTIKDIRLKAVTLLALCIMARPSDLAPKANIFDAETLESKQVPLSIKQLQFGGDGSLTLALFGIKNDTSRTGFEIRIPASSEQHVDPVSCLKCYIDRTQHLRVLIIRAYCGSMCVNGKGHNSSKIIVTKLV